MNVKYDAEAKENTLSAFDWDASQGEWPKLER